jgi:aerotaxis receptor
MFPATAAALGAWALGRFGIAPPIALSGAVALSAAQYAVTAGFVKRRLAALTSSANHMAAGDLTHGVDVGRRDAAGLLARALRQLGVNVHSLVNDAKTQVASMTVSTREIAAGNQDLATRTESQASSLEQTAAALDELTSTVRGNTDSANRAARLAGEATEITRASDQAVGSMATTMKSIHEASKRIAEIVQVIEGISFQTNLLALNAAVEAARAGAHGRGFAIVAGEVRALSQRTAAASQEIKKLIADAAERVDAGTREAGTARESIHGAVAAVEEVSTLVGAISVASNEQLTGISQVNEVVSHLDGITQHNAAMVEELTAAAASLAAGAQELSDAVGVFRIEAPGTKR